MVDASCSKFLMLHERKVSRLQSSKGKIDHVLRRVPDEHIRYVPYRSCPGYGLSRGVPTPRCAMALAETPVGGLTFQLASLPLYLKYELFLEALE